MRRILFLLLTLLLIVGMFGCNAPQEKEPEHSVVVYYRRTQPTYGSADSVIAAYNMPTEEQQEALPILLTRYFESAPSDEFSSPFPTGLSLVSFENDAYTAKIVLSHNFSNLTGIDLSIACICLTRTVISLTSCSEVIISAEDALLDGHRFITLGQDSYLLLDNIPVQP